MFNKKKKLTNLSKVDLAELIKRVEMENQQMLIAQALMTQRRIWLNECLMKLGLNMSNKYEIDFNDGAVKEKEEPKNESKGSKEIS